LAKKEHNKDERLIELIQRVDDHMAHAHQGATLLTHVTFEEDRSDGSSSKSRWSKRAAAGSAIGRILAKEEWTSIFCSGVIRLAPVLIDNANRMSTMKVNGKW